MSPSPADSPSLFTIKSQIEVKIKGHKPKTLKIIPVKIPFFSGKYFQLVFKIG
jgi:hypothetical protein